MNVKKLAITGATVALLFGTAAGALATNRHHNSHNNNNGTSVDVDVTNNSSLTNNVTTKANSGYNEISTGNGIEVLSRGHHRRNDDGVKNSDINTGDAWASATVLNDVNNTSVDLCGCLSNLRGGSRLNVDVTNGSSLTNNITTKGNTGHNEIYGGNVRNSDITSGNAGAEAGVTNWVNTNTLGGSAE